MNSIILGIASRFILPLMFFYSLFLLLTGHHTPGGGFVGGLLASGGFVLYALAYGTMAAKKILRIEPHTFLGTGLGLALTSGTLSFFTHRPFLTGCWVKFGPWEFGTPLMFDIGVYLVVLGTLMMIFLHLTEMD